MSRDQVTVSEVAEAAAQTLRDSMYHSMPGQVVAFHPGTASTPATVDVQPMVHDMRPALADGSLTAFSGAMEPEPWPVLKGIPVSYPRGGRYFMQFPLAAGNQVTLIAFDLDPTNWRTQGANGGAQAPADIRRHGGGYWYALPCDLTDPGALQSGPVAANALVIGVDGGQPQIIINGSTIQLGATGGDAVALASKVDAVFAKLLLLCEALGGPNPIVTPSTGIPVAPMGGGALGLADQVAAAITGTVGSSLVKVQP